MKHIISLAVLLTFFSSCKEAVDEKTNPKETEVELKPGDVTPFETLFDETTFPSKIEYNLLKELAICDTVVTENPTCAICSPEYFKIIPFRTDKPLNDAFLLQIKALTTLKDQTAPLPMRHLIIFERVNGELVKVNGFRGNLIAQIETASGIKDLMVRFYIPDEGAFFNCLFTWKEDQYKFVSVEAIDGAGGHGAVKKEMKESVSKDVYQTLMSNAMLF